MMETYYLLASHKPTIHLLTVSIIIIILLDNPNLYKTIMALIN